jgi:hypothetical protein
MGGTFKPDFSTASILCNDEKNYRKVMIIVWKRHLSAPSLLQKIEAQMCV